MDNQKMINLIHFCGEAFMKARLYNNAIRVWQIGTEYNDKLSYINLAKIYVDELIAQNKSKYNSDINISPELCRMLMITIYQNFPEEVVPFLEILIDLPNIPQEDKEHYEKLLQHNRGDKNGEM